MTQPIDYIAEAIDRWHEDHREGPRQHLGCSIAGDECARKIWLQYRLALKPTHSGRQLRMFRRGHREEETVYDDLRAIGIEVTGIQDRADFGAGVSGSFDGIIELSGVRTLLEIKGLNEDRFKALKKHGVKKSELEYWRQMQLGMLGLGLGQALFFVTCKDNDDRRLELVLLERDEAERIRDRAVSIALANEAPPRISSDPAFYLCKMCDQRKACFEASNWVNCRTCAHSTHTADDKWVCERWELEIPDLEAQLIGCDSHVMHPHVVPSWERLESIGEFAAPYRIPSGTEVINGNPEELPGAVTSRELIGGKHE